MSAVQQLVAWLAGTCVLWLVLWGIGAWVVAAPAAENWTDERTWGKR